MKQAMSTHLGEALGTDFFSVREQFTDEQRTHFITVWKTSARPDGDGWVLNGRKRWIGLGSVADLVVVWARNQRGKPLIVDEAWGAHETRAAGYVGTGAELPSCVNCLVSA